MCRPRRELSNAYFLAKFGFDRAENEPMQSVGGPGRHEVGRQPRAEVQAQVLAVRLRADLSRDRSPGSSEAKNNDLEA